MLFSTNGSCFCSLSIMCLSLVDSQFWQLRIRLKRQKFNLESSCATHVKKKKKISLELTRYLLRKKKLTAHWRNFIHPLMWRCKWTELRIKEFESKASKYAKEISIIDRINHMPLDKTTVDNYGSKSLPFPLQSHRKRPLKRRKRKRVEATTDIASYMSNHILFSERGFVFFLLLYYSLLLFLLSTKKRKIFQLMTLVAENKRPDLDGVPTWENHGNSGLLKFQMIQES